MELSQELLLCGRELLVGQGARLVQCGEFLDLREAVESRFLATLRPMELLVPYDEGGRLSELHDLAGEMEREDTAEGVLVKARVPASAASRFERFELNGSGS